jgi:hypothetical protein
MSLVTHLEGLSYQLYLCSVPVPPQEVTVQVVARWKGTVMPIFPAPVRRPAADLYAGDVIGRTWRNGSTIPSYATGVVAGADSGRAVACLPS